MGYDPSVVNAWAQAYGPPAASNYSAPTTTNYGNLSSGIGQDVLSKMQSTRMWDPSGGNGEGGQWGWSGGEPIYNSDPNGNPQPTTYQPSLLSYHPPGQGPGEQYPTFDPKTGEFKGYQTGSKVQSYASGIASVAGAALGMGAAFGGAGAGGYAAGGYAGGGGAGAGAGAGATAAGGAGGAGVTGFGDAGTMYAGSDAAAAGTLGGGGSIPYGAGAAGVAGAAGGGGSGGGAGGSGASTAPRSGLMSSFTNPDGSFNWGSLIGPATQLAGGYLNASAASSASHDQLTAAREAAAMFEPWRQAGAWGIGQAANMAGKNGPDAATAAFQQDPGYQFRLDQGNQALTRAAAASGGLGSGKYLKDAMSYNQGQASQEFGNSYNRLMALAGMGQTATGSAADYTTQGANAQAAGKVGQANAYNNALTQGYGMYQQNQLVNRLFPGSY